MTSRLMAIAGCLAAGHALLFGLFWLLLWIPESTVTMLVASALVVASMALLVGCVEGIGLLAWQADARPRTLLRRSIRVVPGVWLAIALFVVVWNLVAYFGNWWVGHQGETDAWLMLHFSWANTGKLHIGVGWLLAFVRFAGFSVAVTVASACAAGGVAALLHWRSVRDGLRPRRLLMLAAILLVFVWLPNRGVTWRPTWLEPNWQETVFVGAKLGVLYLLANIGWALVLGVAAHQGRDGLRNGSSADHRIGS